MHAPGMVFLLNAVSCQSDFHDNLEWLKNIYDIVSLHFQPLKDSSRKKQLQEPLWLTKSQEALKTFVFFPLGERSCDLRLELWNRRPLI